MTQRELPQMAMIHPELATEAGIVIHAVGPTGHSLSNPSPIFVPRAEENSVTQCNVTVWEDSFVAVDQGDSVAVWLQGFLSTPGLRLVRFSDTAQRPTDPRFGVGETAFADGFPILVTSQASVDDVNKRVPNVAITTSRFRPNVHIAGCHAFEEDEIRAIEFGSAADRFSSKEDSTSVRLRLIKPCSRCSVPTVDPQTAQRTPAGQPLRALREYRTGGELKRRSKLHRSHFEREDPEEVFFGQNALVDFVPGASLSVGDVGIIT